MQKASVKDCILIACISFTAVSMILSLLGYIENPLTGMGYINYLQIFVCTSLIAFFTYFVDRIPVESQGVYHILMLLNVATVIFGVGGGIFHWFSWSLTNILIVGVILTVVYIITTLVMFWQDREVAKMINNRIKENEDESHN